jgi:hypothetical protein
LVKFLGRRALTLQRIRSEAFPANEAEKIAALVVGEGDGA